jgi:hypothetical protein
MPLDKAVVVRLQAPVLLAVVVPIGVVAPLDVVSVERERHAPYQDLCARSKIH